MGYTRAHFDLQAPTGQSSFHRDLGLQNIGISILTFRRGQGFDYFHNHREQEEIYLCLAGSADLRLSGDSPETIELEVGDIIRVDPGTLRAIGNSRAEHAVVLIAGGCNHPYPTGIGDHGVIADVLTIEKKDTGFSPVAGSTGAKDPPPDDC